jgi:UDP-N-acetylglucosamine acyltransferase
MATAHIAHDCHIGDNVIVNGVALAGHVTVSKFAVIGGLAAVHQFIHWRPCYDFWRFVS